MKIWLVYLCWQWQWKHKGLQCCRNCRWRRTSQWWFPQGRSLQEKPFGWPDWPDQIDPSPSARRKTPEHWRCPVLRSERRSGCSWRWVGWCQLENEGKMIEYHSHQHSHSTHKLFTCYQISETWLYFFLGSLTFLHFSLPDQTQLMSQWLTHSARDHIKIHSDTIILD